MKILYIDTATDGHHIAYMKELVNAMEYDAIIALPEKVNELNVKQYIFDSQCYKDKCFTSYIKWINEVEKLVYKTKPDIIHFLMGDRFYRFFGLGLKKFKKFKTIITLHWVRPGKIQRKSLKSFAHKVDAIVVHSEYLLNELNDLGIKNGVHIEYPQFRKNETITTEEGRKYWGIQGHAPLIVCIGNTRYDKGLDILLDALNGVSADFYILIAGKAESFDEKFIKAKALNYLNRVTMTVRYLADREIELAVAAADIIALPYRKKFNGASGPLGEGVCMDKCIVGADHGNLGYTIREYHLGYTFESENVHSLTKTLNNALSHEFAIDEKYLKYKSMLDTNTFREKYLRLYKRLT
mgnify:CR=1 FL=1